LKKVRFHSKEKERKGTNGKAAGDEFYINDTVKESPVNRFNPGREGEKHK